MHLFTESMKMVLGIGFGLFILAVVAIGGNWGWNYAVQNYPQSVPVAELQRQIADLQAKLVALQTNPSVPYVPPPQAEVPPTAVVSTPSGTVAPAIPPNTPPQQTGIAKPTGQVYAGASTPVVEGGIKYTGKSCTRNDSAIGREGYNADGALGCWKK